jgi:outer membrane protein insertion porin family
MLRKTLLGAGLLLCATLSFAIEPFVISDITVEGNGRLDDGTIFNYLPLKVGDEVDDEEARLSIKALFETGFFRNVKLSKDGTTLVVEVEERPSIAGVSLAGNKDIKSDDIYDMLSSAELTEGRIFNQRRLNEVIKGLSDAYFARGRYSAQIEEDIQILDQNRARITLNIKEGRVAKIREINIIGNEAFSDRTLLRRMELTTKRGFGFGRRDLYSKQKLEGDQEALRSYYSDRGYFEFDIRSTNVTISPNKQDIDIFISLHEGPLYEMGELSLQADESLELDEAALLDVGDAKGVFSRKVISEIRERITSAMADKGFGVASVNPVPEVDSDAQAVNVKFVVNEGKRLYVRRINIVGNTITQDQVIRRELRQLEGSRFSAADVRRSQERLQRLGHFEVVNIDTVPVVGVEDQVDLSVAVIERASTGSINFSVGYGEADGAIFQLGYNQRNFLGTGREVAITLDNSSVTDVYEVRYTNPYYTTNGVSRSFFLNATQVDSAEADTAEFFLDSIELGTSYKIPISEDNSVGITFFAEDIGLEASDDTPPEFADFIANNPDSTDYGLRTSIAKDTLNDFLFPTSGSRTSISLDATLPGSDLEYYKVNILGSKYFELSRSGLSIKSEARLGFGGSYSDEGDLPFFKNYFAGGTRSVRGFRSRSLGPEDSGDTPEPLGGDRRVLANVSLFSPKFGSINAKDKRLSAFIDAGMVFGPDDDLDLGEMRYSAGIALQWFNVLGPLSLSYALPLNDEDDDNLQKFQISLGTLFR